MNYLGLNGLLGLTGDAGRAAGAGGRPDRRPRRRRADGGVRDPGRAARARALRARASSSTSRCSTARCRGWRWSPRETFADGRAPRRGELQLAGALICYRPYACADGYVTLGALEPKFWQAFCRGVGREDLIEHAVRPARLGRAPRRSSEIFAERTREQWRAFASEHDCCLEPVLELDEALDSELVARARDGRRARPAGRRARRSGCSACRSSSSRTPGDPTRAPGPGARRAHRRGARRGRLHRRARSRRCTRPARSPDPARRGPGLVPARR